MCWGSAQRGAEMTNARNKEVLFDIERKDKLAAAQPGRPQKNDGLPHEIRLRCLALRCRPGRYRWGGCRAPSGEWLDRCPVACRPLPGNLPQLPEIGRA